VHTRFFEPLGRRSRNHHQVSALVLGWIFALFASPIITRIQTRAE
jgi:hypothetical protein